MSSLYYKALEDIAGQKEFLEPDEYFDAAEEKVNRMSNAQLLDLICNLIEKESP